MPDHILPLRELFEKIHVWNQEADVYKYGSLQQQALKVYRYLGGIAEGVQKLDHLAVASATGGYVVNLFSTLSFAGVTADEFNCVIVSAGTEQGTMPLPHMVHLLMKRTVELISMANRYDGPAGKTMMLAMMLDYLKDTLRLLNALVSKSGFYLDRAIANAANQQLTKTGKLDEFGMFYSQSANLDTAFDNLQLIIADSRKTAMVEAFGLTEEQMAEPKSPIRLAVQTSPSGWVLSKYIKHTLINDGKKLLGGYDRTEFLSLERLTLEFASLVDRTLDRFVRSNPKWAHLLENRLPKIHVRVDRGELDLEYNDHLMSILETLEKDYYHA